MIFKHSMYNLALYNNNNIINLNYISAESIKANIEINMKLSLVSAK